MTRIYISENGNDKNDGRTKETAIYSWKRARKLSTAYMQINVDSTAARQRLMQEIDRLKRH